MTNPLHPSEIHSSSIFWVLLLYVLLVSPFMIWPLDPQPDERRYSIAAAQMLASGDFIVPMSETGELRLTKPPLTYYYVVAGFLLLGETLVGAKLFFLLSATAIIALTFSLARALGASVVGGLLSAAMLAGHGLFFTTSTQYIPDTPLVLGTTCALLGFVHVLKRTARPFHLYLAWLGIAWAILAKGFIPLILVILYIGASVMRRGPGLPSALRRHEVFAIALALIVTLPWFVIVAFGYWDTLVLQFVGDQVTNKVQATPASVLAGLGKTTKGLFFNAMPGLLALAIARRVSGPLDTNDFRNAVVYLLVAWIVVNLLIFTVSRQIFGRYTLPAAPALMALVGLYATALPTETLFQGLRRVVRNVILPVFAVIGVAGGALGIWFGAGGWGVAVLLISLAASAAIWSASSTQPLRAALLLLVVFFPTLELAKLPTVRALFMPTDGQIAARRIAAHAPQGNILIVDRGAQLVDRIAIERSDFSNLYFSRDLPETPVSTIIIFWDAALLPRLEDAGYQIESVPVLRSFAPDPSDIWSMIVEPDPQRIRQDFGIPMFFAISR